MHGDNDTGQPVDQMIMKIEEQESVLGRAKVCPRRPRC